MYLSLLLISFICFSNSQEQNDTMKNNIITLNENNVVTIRGVISEDTASKFISDISKISENNIYIFLLTPGGSIDSGNSIIQHMNALTLSGKKLYCIAEKAYSMGFVIFQSCPVRYVMPNSIIMQHQASLHIEGPIEQAKNQWKLYDRVIKQIVETQSSRLNLSEQEFKDLYVHDMWLYGDEIIQNKAADEIVNVICSINIIEKYINITVHTFFGHINIEYPMCPLIHMHKSVSWAMEQNKLDTFINSEVNNIVNSFDIDKFKKF